MQRNVLHEFFTCTLRMEINLDLKAYIHERYDPAAAQQRLFPSNRETRFLCLSLAQKESKKTFQFYSFKIAQRHRRNTATEPRLSCA